MSPWTWLRRTLFNEDDALESYRGRIALPGGAFALVLLTPFAVNNLLEGRVGPALAIIAVQVALLIDIIALKRGRPPPVHYGFIILAMVAAILVVVQRQGIYGALWSYPVMLVGYFLLKRRHALLFSLGFLLLMGASVAYWIDPLLAVRVGATLLLTILLVNFVLNVIGELKEALVLQANTDPLTGIFNRRHMTSSLEFVVEQGRRRVPNNALLVLDIDHFKMINDLFGHGNGDEVLRGLVRVLSERKRKADLMFRAGGEEFVILLIEADETTAIEVANEMRRRIEEANLLPGHRVTASVGVAGQRAGESVDDWLRRADAALYRAKDAGRNRVKIAA
jgi:diguanylate cyclase (GGDEF)-like protein